MAMKIMTAYDITIKNYNHVFKDSVRIYRNAVDFLINVCLKEWDSISVINGLHSRCIYVESLVHKTKKRPVVPYDFDSKFYKFNILFFTEMFFKIYMTPDTSIESLSKFLTMKPEFIKNRRIIMS